MFYQQEVADVINLTVMLKLGETRRKLRSSVLSLATTHLVLPEHSWVYSAICKTGANTGSEMFVKCS